MNQPARTAVAGDRDSAATGSEPAARPPRRPAARLRHRASRSTGASAIASRPARFSRFSTSDKLAPVPIGDLGQREPGQQLRPGEHASLGDQRFGARPACPARLTIRTSAPEAPEAPEAPDGTRSELQHARVSDRVAHASPAHLVGEHPERQDVRRSELVDLRRGQRFTRARPFRDRQIDIHCRINSTIRTASASAARPCSPGTAGARLSRTAATKSSSSRLSGSSPGTASLPPSIFGRPAGCGDQLTHLDFVRARVDRHVALALEEADLPNLIPADAARREVGDAAVLEPQPRVGDVHPRRQHRHADGLDALDLARDDAQDQIEVVNHQVEDDVDVEAAAELRAEAMHLDEARIVHVRAAPPRPPD